LKMLFTGCFRSVVLICFYANFIYAAKCPDNPKVIEPCRCYPETKQIRCENANATLTSTLLKQIFTNADLKGDWEILYINNTQISSIEAQTFKDVHFTGIFISNNPQLASIAPDSFTTSTKTVTIEIRENKKLQKSGLFNIAKLFGGTVVTIGFDGNDIENFNDFSFAASQFKNLESLNLQNQKTINTDTSTTTLPATFIDKLTKLKQLSLDSIGLETISNGAIDLSAITAPHISVFLNNNNLAASEVTSKKIKIPTGTATVGLVLDHNKITELTSGEDGNVPLFESIATKIGGNVYLKENTIATCTCTAVSPLKALVSRIHFTTNPVCDTDKTIGTCP
jgi:hypothetical protein